MSIKKILVSAAVMVLGVVGVMHVAIADPPSRVTVCVASNGHGPHGHGSHGQGWHGQGSHGHTVTIPVQAADAPAFDRSCGSSGRVSAADTNEELAETA